MLLHILCGWVQSPGLNQWVLTLHSIHGADPVFGGGSLSWRKVMERPFPTSPELLALVGAALLAAARQLSPFHG